MTLSLREIRPPALGWSAALAFLLFAVPAQPQPDGAPRLVPQAGHGGLLQNACITFGSQFVASAGWDGTVRLWHFETGVEVRTILDVRATEIMAVACSPVRPELAILNSKDNEISLFNLAENRTRWKQPGVFIPQKESLAFSADGSRIFVASGASSGAELTLLRATDGAEIADLRLPAINSDPDFIVASPAPDARRAVVGYERSSGSPVRVLGLPDGNVETELAGPTEGVASLSFSTDGSRIVGCGDEGNLYLWDAGRSDPTSTVPATPEQHCRSAHFVNEDEQIAVFATERPEDGLASIVPAMLVYEVPSLRIVRRVPHAGWYPHPTLAMSPDGQHVVTKLSTKAMQLYSVGNWEARVIAQAIGRVWALGLSGDDERLLVRHERDNLVSVIDLGRREPAFQLDDLWGAILSPDGQSLASTRAIIDLQTGKSEQSWSAPAKFTPDGRLLLDGTPAVWDVDSDALVSRLDVPTIESTDEGGTTLTQRPNFKALAISGDGALVAGSGINHNADGSYDMSVRVWDTASGRIIARLPHKEGWVESIEFSRDGRRVLVSGHRASIWDVESAEELQHFSPDRAFTSRAVFAANDTAVLTANDDGRLTLWDAGDGTAIRNFEGHSGNVTDVVVAERFGIVISSGESGELKFWRLGDGTEILEYHIFGIGDWAVIDSLGRFDAARTDTKGLYWSVQDEAIELAQLKSRYFEPGLLAKHIGMSAEPLSDVPDFDDPELFPAVAVPQTVGPEGKLRIVLSDRGGGFGRVVVSVNGKEFTPDARELPENDGAEPIDGTLTLTVDLAGDPRLDPARDNTIEVRAFNADEYVQSRGVAVAYTPAGELNVDPPKVWIVAVGVSDYAGSALDLKFGASDAEAFAAAMSLGARRLLGDGQLNLAVLSTNLPDALPTRQNIEAAIRNAWKSQRDDLFVLYLAGHGLTYGRDGGDFYYLTRDASSADLADPAVRASRAISSSELADLIKKIPADKTVVIFDTCASGAAFGQLLTNRTIPPSQVLAIERLKDRTGFHVLASSAADRVSYEATPFRQGLLTYSLLEGMRGAALQRGEYVDVLTLYNYAADRVPELARGVGGVQRPLHYSPAAGASFILGRLTTRDREQIPLAMPRPIFVRSQFRDNDSLLDDLGLSDAVNEALLGLERSNGDFVFIEADRYPGAYRIVGDYRRDGDDLIVRTLVYRGTDKSDEREVRSGAATIVQAVLDYVAEAVDAIAP